jgi:hypothetical protein
MAFARGARTGVRITRAPSEVNTSSKTPVNLAFDEEQHVDPLEEHGVDVEQIAGDDPSACVFRNCPQLGPLRHGAAPASSPLIR